MSTQKSASRIEKDTLLSTAKSSSRHVPVSRARMAQIPKKTERPLHGDTVSDARTSEPALMPLRHLIMARNSLGFGQESLEGAATLSQEQMKAVAELPLLKGLEPSVRDSLLQRGTLQTLNEGELLFREGEPCKAVMALVKGTAKLFFTAGNGRIAHTRWLFAPASVGTSEALANAPHATAVSLIEKSTIFTLGAEDFRRAASTSPRLIENVLQEASAELRESMALARSLLFDDTQARLAQLFVSLLDKRGLPGREGRMIPLALTQQDFAEALGVDLRSINRVMVDWFGTGLVVKSEKRFCVREMEKLEGIAFASKAK